jgi:hypothetical protein
MLRMALLIHKHQLGTGSLLCTNGERVGGWLSAYLAQQPQEFVAFAIDFEVRRGREAGETVCERVDKVHDVLCVV